MYLKFTPCHEQQKLIQASRSIQGAVEKTKQLWESPIILQEPKQYKPPSSKVRNRISCTTKIPSSKPIWDTKLCNKSPRWILKIGFLLHTILYLATKIHLQNPPGIQNHATKNPRWILKMGFCLLHTILHLATKCPSLKTHLGYKIMDF